MSQETRNKQNGDRDINRTATGNGEKKNYEGFEGMNYEQIRQPFNAKYKNRSSSNDERKDGKRPDEG